MQTKRMQVWRKERRDAQKKEKNGKSWFKARRREVQGTLRGQCALRGAPVSTPSTVVYTLSLVCVCVCVAVPWLFHLLYSCLMCCCHPSTIVHVSNYQSSVMSNECMYCVCVLVWLMHCTPGRCCYWRDRVSQCWLLWSNLSKARRTLSDIGVCILLQWSKILLSCFFFSSSFSSALDVLEIATEAVPVAVIMVITLEIRLEIHDHQSRRSEV